MIKIAIMIMIRFLFLFSNVTIYLTKSQLPEGRVYFRSLTEQWRQEQEIARLSVSSDGKERAMIVHT